MQGGAIVPNSILNVGTQTSTIRPNLPSLGWNGTAFLLVWSETAIGAPNPLMSATIPPTMTNIANVVGAPLTIRSNAGFNSLAIGTCGFGLTYAVFSSSPWALEVHP
jgi:hypothetical protein